MWDPQAVRAGLQKRADGAERAFQKSLAAVLRDERSRVTAQTSVDLTAAEVDVCAALLAGTWQTREALLGQVAGLMASARTPRAEVRDPERYAEQYRRTCEQLIRDWAG